MKRFNLLTGMVYLAGISVFAQQPPSIATPANDTLLINSGQNFLLIPDVDDHDGLVQEITFNVTSSDTSILEIDDVAYTAGHTFAIIHAREKGIMGSVTLSIEAVDPDGSANTSFDVFVGPYHNPGINFEIHDIVFWQQVVPLDANPAFTMIARDGEAPYDEIDLPALNLSVYSDCQTSPPCTGTDFFTALFKGYLIPPATGEYFFYMSSGDQCSIGLSSDEDFDHATVILHSSGGIGISSGDKEWRSVQQTLEAGKVYAIYGTQWNIHTLIGGMLWEGPGLAKQYIQGDHLSYVFDVEKPTVPQQLTLVATGINDLRITWNSATDDRMLKGYNVYVNGHLYNLQTVQDTVYNVLGLTADTRYSLMVTSLDMAGNESPAGNLISRKTYLEDNTPPSAPDTIEPTVISDLAVKVEWSGAADGETEVRGYNVYVDGGLYNTGDYIYQEEVVVMGLSPETSYQIEIEAVDAGYNLSDMSIAINISTTAFDPFDTGLTDKKARLVVKMENIGINEGLGINPDFLHGEFIDDPEQDKLIRELRVAGIRWGALTANPLNFADYIGAGKTMTLGRFMNYCNGIDAYSIITCGVENATDWMTDPETFTNFLEYIAGPSGSEYGAIRAAEGYTGSLLEASRGLIFEFGNEVWGASAHDAQIGSDYAVYGEWCRDMAVLMRSSEYYDPEKIYLVYSGREPRPSFSYGLHEKLLKGDTGEVDWLSVGGYLGGNLDYAPSIDPGKSELDYYKNGIATVEANLKGRVQTMEQMVDLTAEIKPTFMYEANMTKSSYFGRLGQAIVQTDYYACAQKTGGTIPTVFHLTGGQWKMVIPAQDYKKTPLFHTTAYFNRYCKGNILKSDLETMALIRDSDGEVLEFEPVGCHVYTRNGRYTLLLISRDFENGFTVQADLPDDFQITSPDQAKMYVISGTHYSDKDALIDSADITISDGLLIEVPRYSMVIVTFEGEDQQFEPLPLGHYEYVSADTVTIIPFGSDDLDITGSGKRIYLAEVKPDNVLSDRVMWEIDTNGVNVSYMERSYGYDITPSGTCDGNGTITLKAWAWDNPSVYDEVTIHISNQGENCGTGIDEASRPSLKIFPNPAGDVLHLENLQAGDIRRIIITDILGRRQLDKIIAGPSYEADISGLPPGLYHLSVLGPHKTDSMPFIKE